VYHGGEILLNFFQSNFTYDEVIDFFGYFADPESISQEQFRDNFANLFDETKNATQFLWDIISKPYTLFLQAANNESIAAVYESIRIMDLDSHIFETGYYSEVQSDAIQFANDALDNWDYLKDIMIAIDISPTAALNLLERMSNKRTLKTITINDFIKLFDYDTSLIIPYLRAIPKMFTSEYTLEEFIEDFGADPFYLSMINKTVNEIFETETISFDNVIDVVDSIRLIITGVYDQSQKMFRSFAFETFKLLAKALDRMSIMERIELIDNAISAINPERYIGEKVSECHFFELLIYIDDVISSLKEEKTLLYNDMCEKFGKEDTDLFLNVVDMFINGSDIWKPLGIIREQFDSNITNFMFNVAFTIHELLNLLANETTKFEYFIKTICNGMGINESTGEETWDSTKDFALIISNEDASIFQNKTYNSTKTNSTVLLEEIFREIVDAMKDIGISTLEKVFGDSEEIFDTINEYVHNSSVGADQLLLFLNENYTVNGFIEQAESMLVKADEWIDLLYSIKISDLPGDILKIIKDNAAFFIDWFKNHRKLTFDDLYYGLSGERWDYSFGVKINGSTTILEALDYFPKSICDLTASWINIQNLVNFSLIDIMKCFIVNEGISSRRALGSNVEIFRNSINKIVDIGPKFDDGSVELGDLGSGFIIENMSVAANFANTLTLTKIISYVFDKDSTELSNHLIKFTANLRNNTVSIDNIYNIMRSVSNLLIKDDDNEETVVESSSVNIPAIIVISLCVCAVFVVLIIISISFRIKYSKE
jgi:hypothetical protein